MSDTERGEWLGPGTWLVDSSQSYRSLGVITDVQDRDREMGARLAIRWRPNVYQNISVLSAIENFKRGIWNVDDGNGRFVHTEVEQ